MEPVEELYQMIVALQDIPVKLNSAYLRSVGDMSVGNNSFNLKILPDFCI
jgi:hypothetical protein